MEKAGIITDMIIRGNASALNALKILNAYERFDKIIKTFYRGLGFIITYDYSDAKADYYGQYTHDLKIYFDHVLVFDSKTNTYIPGPWEELLSKMVENKKITNKKGKEYETSYERALKIDTEIEKIIANDKSEECYVRLNKDITVYKNPKSENPYVVSAHNDFVYICNKYHEIQQIKESGWEEVVLKYMAGVEAEKLDELHKRQKTLVHDYMDAFKGKEKK
ncbi:MAG: hypothetical protein J5892_02385 [Bacilli bacterium]|nr:hypothetical protein [Bacilli bacterium]